MTKRIIILTFLCLILLCSCVSKKLYKATLNEKINLKNKFDSTIIAHRNEKIILQNKYDSISKEDSKKATLNQILESQKDSLINRNLAIEREANDFVHKYIRVPRGAKFSSKAKINSSKQYQSSGITKTNVLYNPTYLSPWGNIQYGDCVTAEEAFAKASNNPEIVIPEEVAIGWASENGVLNGAQLLDVLAKMRDVGFRLNGTTHNDGIYSRIDFTNPAILQNAISTGPVKLGLTSDQLLAACNFFKRGWFALGFRPEPITADNQHCASLCGYGTLAWLAQQFNVPLPYGVDGQQIGYAIFTWGTIGIIDQQSLFAITHEAFIRSPTNTTNNSVSSFILKAMGGETNLNLYLSHEHSNTDLHGTYPGGFGEMWICHDLGGGRIKLQTRGAEGALAYYFSHAKGKLDLRADRGSGEEWIVHDLGNGQIALEASGDEVGKYLSHAGPNLFLQDGYRGTGEAWQNTGQH